MYAITVYTFIQTGLQPGTVTGNLSIANQLGIAVASVCLLILVLMFSHYYRMAGSRDKQVKKKGKEAYNPVVQYEYMSREDLKAMILKEKAAREKAAGETGSPISNETKPAVQEAVQCRLFDLPEVPPECAATNTPEATADADLIAKLLMPSQTDIEKAKEEEAIKPKHEGHKYIDKVERSLLSNESPEEFMRKSRKI